MWRGDHDRGSGENARETKIKTGNQRTSREERRLFSVLVFQMALHLGLWPPLPLAIAQGTLYQSTEEAGGYQFTRREEAEEEERKQTNY